MPGKQYPSYIYEVKWKHPAGFVYTTTIPNAIYHTNDPVGEFHSAGEDQEVIFTLPLSSIVTITAKGQGINTLTNKKVKKYLVFVGGGKPLGGMSDCIGVFDTLKEIEEELELIKIRRGHAWMEVVDMEEGMWMFTHSIHDIGRMRAGDEWNLLEDI